MRLVTGHLLVQELFCELFLRMDKVVSVEASNTMLFDEVYGRVSSSQSKLVIVDYASNCLCCLR